MVENADLQSRVHQVTELQQQLESSEREKQTVRRQLESSEREKQTVRQQLESSEREKQTVRQQLMMKEAELTRAEETIRRVQLLVSLVCDANMQCVTRGPPDCRRLRKMS